MKKLLLAVFVTLSAFSAFSQELPALDNIQMTTKDDFRAKDSIALQTANYVLSTPSDIQNMDRMKAASFLLKWMGGSPEYTFDLNPNVTKYFDSELDLLGVYLASMTTYALQNKPRDSKAITLNGTKKFIAYIDNPDNNVQMNSKLKELSEANKKGELESLLKL